jgi:hypothetical protein
MTYFDLMDASELISAYSPDAIEEKNELNDDMGLETFGGRSTGGPFS